jgi:hypothetical protein
MAAQPVNKLTRILLLCLAAVMLLPVYGSWIDVHYAARQPGHKHIYFGKVDINHHRTSDSKDVVNLPDQDATGQSAVAVYLTAEETITHLDEIENLSFHLADDYLSPEDAFLPPPDHPPQI